MNKDILTISFVMQKNGQTYLKNQVYLKSKYLDRKFLKVCFTIFYIAKERAKILTFKGVLMELSRLFHAKLSPWKSRNITIKINSI